MNVQAESAARTESLQLCAAAGCQGIYTLQISCNAIEEFYAQCRIVKSHELNIILTCLNFLPDGIQWGELKSEQTLNTSNLSYLLYL